MSDYCMLFSRKHFYGLLLLQFNQDRRPAGKLVKIDVTSSLNTSNYSYHKKKQLLHALRAYVMITWGMVSDKVIVVSAG